MSAPTVETTGTDTGAVRVEGAPRRVPRRRRRRLLVLTALVLLAALLGWLVWWSPVLAVREVRVLGSTAIPADTLRERAGVALGTPLARVPADDVVARVLAIPVVRSAEVRFGWPNTLVLVVTERTPVARLASGVDVTNTTPQSDTSTTDSGSLGDGPYVIDADGVGYRAWGAVPSGLPTVDASAPAWPVAAGALGVLSDPVRAKVVQVQADSPEDVVLVLKNGTRVRWGGAADGAQKARITESLLARRPALIDVSAPALPTTRGQLAR